MLNRAPNADVSRANATEGRRLVAAQDLAARLERAAE
jgi:hypothetical protein